MRGGHPDFQSGQWGFTLLEILVSIGLLTTIAAFSITSLSTQLENKNHLTLHNETQHALHAAMARVFEDVRHAYIVMKEDYGVANLSNRTVKPYLTHNSEGLRFTTQSFVSMIPNSPESNIAVVKYYDRPQPKDSTKKQLIRRFDPAMRESIDNTDVGVEQILLDDLSLFDIRYWNGLEYVEKWDTTTGDYANVLPKMAQIKMGVFIPLTVEEKARMDANPNGDRKVQSLELHTSVYLMYSIGRPNPQTQASEHSWK